MQLAAEGTERVQAKETRRPREPSTPLCCGGRNQANGTFLPSIVTSKFQISKKSLVLKSRGRV